MGLTSNLSAIALSTTPSLLKAAISMGDIADKTERNTEYIRAFYFVSTPEVDFRSSLVDIGINPAQPIHKRHFSDALLMVR